MGLDRATLEIQGAQRAKALPWQREFSDRLWTLEELVEQTSL